MSFEKFIKENTSKIKKGAVVGFAALATMVPSKEVKAQNTNNAGSTDNKTEQVNFNTEKSPFAKEYKTDENFYRASDFGKSIDMSTAQKIALASAKKKLAEEMQSVKKSAIKTDLSMISVVDQKLSQDTNGLYTFWVALEIKK